MEPSADSYAELGPVKISTIDDVRRDSLVNSKGVGYRDFKNTLAPRLGLVWGQLALSYLLIAGTTAAIAWMHRMHPRFTPLTIVLGSLFYGYLIAYIKLFFHEAAHYNIARSRRMNDLLANLFIGLLDGQDIKRYREIHFDHHRYLGTPRDTERTYFESINVRFFLEILTGIKPFKIFLRREKVTQEKREGGSAKSKGTLLVQLGLGMVLNGAFVAGLVFLGYWPAAAAWVVGMAIFYPAFATLRQVLEHRSQGAQASIDYSQVPHGEVHRMFGSGPLASTLGGAGFNRHLLHHFEPQISYTCLGDLEKYLLDTELAAYLQQQRTSYGKTFRQLFNQ
jgi:fatty acid desaturase